MPSSFDRNPKGPVRIRRAMQQLAAFGQGDGVTIGFNSGGQYQAILNSTGGLQASGGLGILLNPNHGLALSASGLAVSVAAPIKFTTGAVSLDLEPLGGLALFSNQLGVKVDGTTVTINGSGALVAAAGTVVSAGDTSITIGGTGSAPTVAVHNLSTGGLQTASGLSLKLAATGAVNVIASADFTLLANGTQVGTIGGSGVTWWVANNTSQPGIPDNTQVNTALVASSGSVVAAVAASGAEAQYVPALSLTSHYVVTASMAPVGTSGFAQACGLFVRGDKVAHAASQGVTLTVFTNRINLNDVTSGALLGTTACVLASGTFYDVSLEVNGNNFTGTVNGNVVTGTTANNATNQGVGFWLGSGSVAPFGVRNFSVATVGVPTYPGLFTDATGVGVLLNPTNPGLVIASAGLSVLADLTTINFVGGNLAVSGVQALAADPGAPIDGNLWYNTTTKGGKARKAGVTLGAVGVLYSNTADGAHAVNTAAATATFTFPTLPAGFWTSGKRLRIDYHGFYSCTNPAPVSLKIGIFWVTVGQNISIDGNPAFSPANGAAGAQFRQSGILVCRTAAVAGLMLWSGVEFFNAAAVSFGPTWASNAVDTTLAGNLKIVLQWSAASASNDAWVDDVTIEILDPP